MPRKYVRRKELVWTPPDWWSKAAEMIEDGKTMEDVASFVGVTRQYVHQIVVRMEKEKGFDSNRRRHVSVEPRECQNPGCNVVFKPKINAKLFCSPKCRREFHKGDFKNKPSKGRECYLRKAAGERWRDIAIAMGVKPENVKTPPSQNVFTAAHRWATYHNMPWPPQPIPGMELVE